MTTPRTVTRRAEKVITPRTPRTSRRTPAALPAPAQRATGVLAAVHETPDAVASIEMTPPHPPRVETPEYAKAHHFIVYVKRAGCQVCGVTQRMLRVAKRNPFRALALETHHYPIERSLMDACDPVKVHADYPQVYDAATLAAFVDSPANLIPLCDVHHRSVEHGIHHLLPQDFAVQRYLRDGYQIAATPKNAAAVEVADEALMTAAAATA